MRPFLKTGVGVKTIAVEFDNYWYTAAAHHALQKHLPNAHFKDAQGLVNWQRAIKSPTEIDYMRKAGRIVEVMHQRIVEKIEPGMRKCDLVAEIYDAGTRGVDGFGGDYPAIVPLLPSGADASAPHLTERSTYEIGRRHILRDRRLLQAISLPALPNSLSR